MRKFSTIMLVWLVVVQAAAFGQGKGSAANPYVLDPSPSTVAWGHYWSEMKPCLTVRSGDFVRIRTVLTSNPERLEAAGVAPADVEPALIAVQAVKDRGAGRACAHGARLCRRRRTRRCPGSTFSIHRACHPLWLQCHRPEWIFVG